MYKLCHQIVHICHQIVHICHQIVHICQKIVHICQKIVHIFIDKKKNRNTYNALWMKNDRVKKKEEKKKEEQKMEEISKKFHCSVCKYKRFSTAKRMNHEHKHENA